MEIAGITLRVLEIITVILCGIRLAVPPGHFRWERLWTKVLYWILVIFWIVLNIGNIYFFKFSSIGELITGMFTGTRFMSLGIYMFLHYVIWNIFI